MEITHYLAHLTMQYVPKNKLQKEVLQYFKSIDRKLVPADQLDQLRREIQSAIQKINFENKRCKALQIYFENNESDGIKDVIVRDIVVVSFTLKGCRYSHISTVKYKSLSNN